MASQTITDASGDDRVVGGKLVDPSHDDRIASKGKKKSKRGSKKHVGKKGSRKGKLPAGLAKCEFKKGAKGSRRSAKR